MAMTSTSPSHIQSPSPEYPAQQVAHPSHPSHIDSTSQLATGGYAPSDNQLAGLVQAATAAAGQDVTEWAAAAAVAAAAAAAAAGHHHLDGYAPVAQIVDEAFEDSGFGGMGSAPGGARQLRSANGQEQSNQGGQGPGLSRAVSKKRKRVEDTLDPALTAADGAVNFSSSGLAHHQPRPQFDGEELDIRELPPQLSLSEARAVGVHSAAALFRQTSSNKKYTRPPMSKLFASLELSPENFLHLQAAAKTYMLDANHPERRDCVGQRGKGDTEMVKLRLWNCVKTFLEAEGNGERFFGENVVNEGMPPRQYIWPRDQHRIISLVIPLLRRMVTNERQRQYAIETRKGGGPEERRRRKTEESLQNLNASQQSPPGQPPSQEEPPQPQQQIQSNEGSIVTSQFLAPLQQPGFPLSLPPSTSEATPSITTPATVVLSSHSQTTPAITLCINIIQNGKRILPRIDVPADQCRDLESAKQLITRRFGGQLPEALLTSTSVSTSEFDEATRTWDSTSSTVAASTPSSVWKFKVWLPNGLVPIQDDGEWTVALLSAGTVDWMDGDLRVILDVPEPGT